MSIPAELFAIVLFALLTVSVAATAAQIYQWTKEYGWRRHFREAFNEWSNSCDWEGYDEIPMTMYDDLVARLETAK